MPPTDIRKLSIYKSLDEYCNSPVSHDQWLFLEAVRQECASAAQRKALVNTIFTLCGFVSVLAYLMAITFTGLPLAPDEAYYGIQIPCALMFLAGAGGYSFLNRRSPPDFLADVECSITIAGKKFLTDKGLKNLADPESAGAHTWLQPVKLGWSRSQLRPQVATLLRNVDGQRRPFMAFELDLIKRMIG